MVGVNPVLECIWAIEEGLHRGDSLRDALLRWSDVSAASRQPDCLYDREFRLQVLAVLRAVEAPGDGLLDHPDFRPSRTPGPVTAFRESLFNILAAGLRGEAVLKDLEAVKSDIQQQLELDMKSHVETLPFKMLIPLLLFLFPAFLILLFGPIVRAFLHSL